MNGYHRIHADAVLAFPALDSQATVVGVLGFVAGVLAGIVVYFFRQVASGKLVPRAQVVDWKEAYKTSEAARVESDKARGEERAQTEELLSLARMTNQAIAAIAARAAAP